MFLISMQKKMLFKYLSLQKMLNRELQHLSIKKIFKTQQ